MENIGDKNVVFKGSFLIPENDNLFFDTHIEGWVLKVMVVFESIPDKKSELRIETERDIAKIIITNWNNSLGTATIAPIKLGTHSNGKILYFMLANSTIGKTNYLSIQLLLGGQDGK